MATYRININGKQYKVKGDMETQVGRKKIFQSLGISIPKESPTITDNGFTYTYGSKPKAVIGSETLKEQKINTRKGIDMYQGRNRSERYDKASADMGNTWMFHPQDYIKPTYWNSQTHKAVKEGGDIAAVVASAPLTVYTGVQAAPYIFNGLKVAGQAMTPSTWINGIGRAAGYNLDKAGTIADLAASAYFANEAGKEIDQNGLTWRTGFNALMSLAPMTRETEAIEGVANAVRRPMSSVSSVVDDFRAARNAVSSPEAVVGREFNRSVKNTRFVNVPVEHVSPNGITRGSALDVGEEGIHLSPTGSPTTYTIQRTTGYPFVRTGTWTFSNNTRPVEVYDAGYFGKGFNPDFDAKVSNGVTNFSYTNNFEGQGNTSYLTTEPNFGLQLSKNTNNNASRVNWEELDIITPEGIKLADNTLISQDILDQSIRPLEKYFHPSNIFNEDIIQDGVKIGKKFIYVGNGRQYSIERYPGKFVVNTPEGSKTFPFSTEGDILNSKGQARNNAHQFILDSRDNWIESLDNISKEIVRRQLIAPERTVPTSELVDNSIISDYIRSSVQSDINDVYLSEEYINRYMKSLGINPANKDMREQVISRIKQDLDETYKTNQPIFYIYHPREGGISNSFFRVYGINGGADQNYFNDMTSTIFHEFGHNFYGQETPTGKYIASYSQKLLKDNPPELTLGAEVSQMIDPEFKGFLEYLSNPNEFRQRIMEGVRYGIKENLTPEEIYNECNIQSFKTLKKNFRKPFLIKMLGLMLGTTPLIVNTTNDKSS